MGNDNPLTNPDHHLTVRMNELVTEINGIRNLLLTKASLSSTVIESGELRLGQLQSWVAAIEQECCR